MMKVWRSYDEAKLLATLWAPYAPCKTVWTPCRKEQSLFRCQLVHTNSIFSKKTRTLFAATVPCPHGHFRLQQLMQHPFAYTANKIGYFLGKHFGY